MTTNIDRSIALLLKWHKIDIAPYQAPYRKYHGLGHMESMLGTVNEIVSFYALSESDLIFLHLATWYHDIVYEVGASDNEDRSARIAFRDTGMNALQEAIRVTKDHRNPGTFLEACLIDADLAGLGASDEIYTANAFKVRDEFNLDPVVWMVGRSAFLDNMSARQNIYYTSWGGQREGAARRNMKNERISLESLRYR